MVSPFIMPYFYGKKLSGGGGRILLIIINNTYFYGLFTIINVDFGFHSGFQKTLLHSLLNHILDSNKHLAIV